MPTYFFPIYSIVNEIFRYNNIISFLFGILSFLLHLVKPDNKLIICICKSNNNFAKNFIFSNAVVSIFDTMDFDDSLTNPLPCFNLWTLVTPSTFVGFMFSFLEWLLSKFKTFFSLFSMILNNYPTSFLIL